MVIKCFEALYAFSSFSVI